jgi:lipid-A-disaccharide synthase
MSDSNPSIFMLAGEPSGDRIGGALLSGLIDQRPGLKVCGVGGEDMEALGLSSLFPMSDLSVMGFSDVIKRLPLLLWRIRQAANYIHKTRPDCVVLIDSQVFSELLARRLRKLGYPGHIVLYVAPSVWAWKPERAPRLKSLFDEVLAVLPFEPRVMRELDGPLTSYVGHPAIARHPEPVRQDNLSAGYLTLLPGSRAGEIRRHMPVMKDIAERFAAHPNVTGIALLTLPRLAPSIQSIVKDWKVPVRTVSAAEEREEVLRQSKGAVVTAGTITLELALAGVPMVGTYVPDKSLMHHYEKAGRPMIALPNIIVGERIIPEVEPGPDLIKDLAEKVEMLLSDDTKAQEQRKAFGKMRDLMKAGEQAQGRQDPVERILKHLDK